MQVKQNNYLPLFLGGLHPLDLLRSLQDGLCVHSDLGHPLQVWAQQVEKKIDVSVFIFTYLILTHEGETETITPRYLMGAFSRRQLILTPAHSVIMLIYTRNDVVKKYIKTGD